MAAMAGRNQPFGSSASLIEWNKQHEGLVQEGINDFQYSFIDAVERLNAQMADIFHKDVVVLDVLKSARKTPRTARRPLADTFAESPVREPKQTVQQEPLKAVEQADQNAEAAQISDDNDIFSDVSSPVRQRKSSFTFTSLPPREPLTAKRVSRPLEKPVVVSTGSPVAKRSPERSPERGAEKVLEKIVIPEKLPEKSPGPLSASKTKLYSVFKSAKGLFASSASASASAKLEAHNTPTKLLKRDGDDDDATKPEPAPVNELAADTARPGTADSSNSTHAETASIDSQQKGKLKIPGRLVRPTREPAQPQAPPKPVPVSIRVASQSKVKALEAAARKKEADDKAAQEKMEKKLDLERKRAATKAEEERKVKEAEAARKREADAKAAQERAEKRLEIERRRAAAKAEEERKAEEAQAARRKEAEESRLQKQDLERKLMAERQAKHEKRMQELRGVSKAQPAPKFVDNGKPGTTVRTSTLQAPSGIAQAGSKPRIVQPEGSQPRESTQAGIKRPHQPDVTHHQDPTQAANKRIYQPEAAPTQENEPKRRRTNEHSVMAPPKRPSTMLRQINPKTGPLVQISNARIPFAEIPNPPGAAHPSQQQPQQHPFKTPVRPQLLVQATQHATMQAHAKSSPQPDPNTIELPEIHTDSEDDEDMSDDEKFVPPDWAASPALRELLTQQQSVNPETIFGPIGELKMDEVFKKTDPSRLRRLRDRGESALWKESGDAVTSAEKRRDMELREKLVRNQGWTYEKY